MHISRVTTEPHRFYDGGMLADGDQPGIPPDPDASPRIVLERHTDNGLELFSLERRIAYRDRHVGELLVPARVGFRTDLTSTPAIFTWLVPKTGAHLPAALLHDVGKIGIPDRILQKSGRLTADEYAEIMRHPVLGVSILTPATELASALPVVKHHHERFDGNGYPDGLRGEGIPLIARIVSVADAFESMIRARPCGYGISRKAALREIDDNSGTQFDPRIVRVLVEIIYAPGDRRAGSAG
jgi:hypothetical protein